tara:strand:- start:1669 stop:3096 length:1428 start_codon:yes stop_codon:yes gene_type:complete
MPRIHTVAADGTITSGDKLLGSDGAENAKFVTRNYTVGGIRDFVIGGTHAGSFTTITTTGNATIGGNLTVTGNATIAGNLTFGDADTDTVSFAADVTSNIIPDITNTYDLGTSVKEWKDIHLSGTARVGSILLNGTNNEISGVADIYAQKIYDSQDSTYFLDPTASISLKAKGNIQLGDASAETNSEITSYGDLILKADVDADAAYERGVEIFNTRFGNDGGIGINFNKNQYDLSGNALPASIWNQIAVGKVVHGLGTGPNNQEVTSATINQIIGWKDSSGNTVGTVLDEPPASAVELQVYVNTAISYSSNSYLTVLASGATFDDNATRSIKFFSGSTEVASINKDGKLTISEIAAGSSAITTTGAFNAGSVTTSGNIVATGTVVANNTDTINGININNTNQEMSGIGEIYAYKFIDSQTGSHYVDPGNSTLSAVFAGKIRMAVPTFADDSAAGTGGLVAGDVYKTSGGDLKIKL